MPIEAMEPVLIAAVDVDDSYSVELRTHRKRTVLDPDEADQLAMELKGAAAEARAKWSKDFPDLVSKIGAHKFDVLPICKECADEHHGACIGSAYVENEFDVDEVECGCAAVDHKVLGGAA
jgi:hypothetical protein